MRIYGALPGRICQRFPTSVVVRKLAVKNAVIVRARQCRVGPHSPAAVKLADVQFEARLDNDQTSLLRRRIVDVEPVDPVSLGHHRSVTRSGSREVAALLHDGIRSGSVTEQEAVLIFATRVLDEPISDLARRAGIHPQSVRKRRRRAEAKLEVVCVAR